MAKEVTSLFSNLSKPRDVTKYNLMRGVTDFGDLAQWNLYESGYAFLKIIAIPKVLEKLAEKNTDYRNLVDTYKKILEFEFRQISGLPSIETEKLDITNNVSTMSMIGKTTMESNVSFSMPYYERSGAPLTKVHELLLRAIKDPKTTYKHYMGLFDSGDVKPEDAGYDWETFTFLVGFTDNTGLQLEKSYLITGVQPNNAPTGELYDYTKGTIENKELSLEFTGFVVTGRDIDARAKRVLDYLNNSSSPEYILKDETKFEYIQAKKIDQGI